MALGDEALAFTHQGVFPACILFRGWGGEPLGPPGSAWKGEVEGFGCPVPSLSAGYCDQEGVGTA